MLRPQALPACPKFYLLVTFHAVKCHLGTLWFKTCRPTKEERRLLPPEYMPSMCPETLNLLLALMTAKFCAEHSICILHLILTVIPCAMCYGVPILQMRKLRLNEVKELTQIIRLKNGTSRAGKCRFDTRPMLLGYRTISYKSPYKCIVESLFTMGLENTGYESYSDGC